ncbi:hypothetical protein [Tahibacter amnicola]|uniref:RHS repeat-associated protein n=1 Tax=Tahibacter amnicola TaxID=2976241 RepID=A0ABY6BIV0_9GAMM|nr:hypothetical protein [Tahibacter amnicola]UXI68546.1 hypothetical protein N4264_02515 [Tahibacter amnicola]
MRRLQRGLDRIEAYDYRFGKFISVDPFIQFPENSQSLNPYSYILNNH